jgi:hypothetical protein
MREKRNSNTWRQYLGKHIFLIFLFIWVPVKCNCSGFTFDLYQTDTIIQKIQNSSLRVLKFNPVQLAFGELPVSLEVFKVKKESIQFQIGILIPFFRELPAIVGSMLPPPSSQLISCRTVPYLSNGISSKIELRKYGKKNYFALQFMYKYSAYTNLPFTIWKEEAGYETHEQIESKSSHIIGLGFMMGRQVYKDSFVIDRYWGFGLRLRMTNGVITAMEYPNPLGRIEMNKPFNYRSVYPFLNFGRRFGKTFPKKLKHLDEASQ